MILLFSALFASKIQTFFEDGQKPSQMGQFQTFPSTLLRQIEVVFSSSFRVKTSLFIPVHHVTMKDKTMDRSPAPNNSLKTPPATRPGI
jgi:hypothetical protein